MKKTISLTDNYRKRLKDEIVSNPGSGLRGEVEIQIRNKDTGKIESIQKKNLIVYGGREWLLKKAFASNCIEDSAQLDKLRKSEILWFGVGSGGGEPGNPLQCGTTYGSDTDLYNPVRLRYEFDTKLQSNPNYASRIINNKAISGYYKKISYIGIKEDLANPYKSNGITYYPNLIAEIRLELSTDDTCGQTYLEQDYERSYADINEAALFIADSTQSDPGLSDNLTTIGMDYYTYNMDNSRYYHEDMNTLPMDKVVKSSDSKKYEWVELFPDNSVQYFDIYRKQECSDPDLANFTHDGKYYKITKIVNEPVLIGVFGKEGTCTGSITLNTDTKQITFDFVRTGKDRQTKTVEYDKDADVKTLDDIFILSHGTIFVISNKYDKFLDNEKEINVKCTYRNKYLAADTSLKSPEAVFKDTNQHTFIFPVNYVFDQDNNLVYDEKFTNFSTIKVTQSTDTYIDAETSLITVDENSTECRIYVDNETIKNITEGLKVFTYNVDIDENNKGHYILEDEPATVVDVFDATKDSSGDTNSYFIIDRKDMKSFNAINEEKPPIQMKLYSTKVTSPYTMFNRVCFSTIRLSHSREVLLLWRIYF